MHECRHRTHGGTWLQGIDFERGFRRNRAAQREFRAKKELLCQQIGTRTSIGE